MQVKFTFVKDRLSLILIIFLIISSCLIVNKILFNHRAYGAHRSYEMVYIKENDTLWDLAIKYNKSQRDHRQVVNEIRSINNLGYKYIQPGDLIKVPVN